MKELQAIRALSHGVNQRGVREHNERLILSILQRHGSLTGGAIARLTTLSAQTVSVILRKLERDGMIAKGAVLRGRVGKPAVPMQLNPEGAFTAGFVLGRRSAQMYLTDLCGGTLMRRRITYDRATPGPMFAFVETCMGEVTEALGPESSERLSGIGVAMPFEMGRWGESSPQPGGAWEDIDLETEFAKVTSLPVFMLNDGTSACWAEQVYGAGKAHGDYAYFYISTFIGGGIVMDNSVFGGRKGNAGALGSLRVGAEGGGTRQLMDVASKHVLEARLQAAGRDTAALWAEPLDWSCLEEFVEPWGAETADQIAQAVLSACAVIDFETVLIDGTMPSDVRAQIVAQTAQRLGAYDSRGLVLPRVEAGSIGSEARARGAACAPLFAQFFLGAPTIRVA